MSQSAQIIYGLILGIATGLFFGEAVGFLAVVGDAFIRLLQMTVLPYVTVALVAGLGSLSYDQAKLLAVRVGGILLLLWAIALSMVFLMPLAFPSFRAASFFSTALIQESPDFNFVELFIPSNPFHSLANNIVPAVVVFSIAVGVALIGIEKKERLIEVLSILGDALTQVVRLVTKLTPIGIFAIAASASGTMSTEDISRLQVYLVTYVAFCLLLTFWVLPGLVTCVTPIRYREILGATKDALVIAFVTGSLFIVLPMLTEAGRTLLNRSQGNRSEADAVLDVIVPASFNFPHTAKLLSLSFLLFAAWFTGAVLPVSQYPTLAGVGLVSFFGSLNAAVPYLLDLLRIPADTFQLFVVTSVINSRFGTLLAAMHTVVLALLGTCAMVGLVSLHRRNLMRYVAITVVLTATTVAGSRFLFAYALGDPYRKDKIVAGMRIQLDALPVEVHREAPGLEFVAGPPGLAGILQRGTIRVGYVEDNLPYSFFNSAGELVGLDVEMAHRLARDLGVSLALFPVRRDRAVQALQDGTVDVVMAGVPVTAELAQALLFSSPYLEDTLAFVVKDHRREDFNRRDSVKALKAPRIACTNVPYYLRKLRNYLPQAEIVLIESARDFFERDRDDVDALLSTAERGSAWSLLYPTYGVAVPHPDVLSAPLAYPFARRNRDLADFVNAWIELKKRDGTIESLRDYWIFGKDVEPKQPRWSIIRNVLHWID